MRLTAKIVIITGAGQGIGEAIAEFFAESGARGFDRQHLIGRRIDRILRQNRLYGGQMGPSCNEQVTGDGSGGGEFVSDQR